MWNDRGDGSSKPLGSLTPLNDLPVIDQVSTGTAMSDTLRSADSYKFWGYTLSPKGEPTFKYTLYGVMFEDDIRLDESAKYFVREIRKTGNTTQQPALTIRLAEGSKIEAMPDGTFAVNDKAYFVKVLDGRGAVVVQNGPKAQLQVPADSKVRYAIMF